MNNKNNWNEKSQEAIDQTSNQINLTIWSPHVDEMKSRPEKIEKIYQSGPNRKAIQDMVKAINSAQQTIILVSFLFAEKELKESLLEAVNRGIRVYMLTAAENRLDQEPKKDSEFDAMILREHKDFLNRIAGKFLLHSAPHFHAKLLLIDANQPNATGYLLTANFTKEALERNQEIIVSLNKTEIQSAYDHSRWAFWEDAEHQLLEKDRLESYKKIGCVNSNLKSSSFLATRPNNSLLEKAKEVIQNAKQELFVTSFGWEEKFELVQLLLQRIQSGLSVIILCRLRPKTMSSLITLAQQGAKVFAFRWLHAKVIWNDCQEAIVMSANLEKGSFQQSLEYGVYLNDSRTKSIKELLNSWHQQAEWKLHVNPKLDELPNKRIKIWDKKDFIDRNVEEKKQVDLGSIPANCLTKMNLPRPKFNAKDYEFVKKLICHWEIIAPVLNKKKAKEVKYTIQVPTKETIQVSTKYTIQVPVTNKDGTPKKDKKGKPILKKKEITKMIPEEITTNIEEHMSHLPPIYEIGGKKVVAINNRSQFKEAQKFLEEKKAEQIIVQNSSYDKR